MDSLIPPTNIFQATVLFLRVVQNRKHNFTVAHASEKQRGFRTVLDSSDVKICNHCMMLGKTLIWSFFQCG